MDFLDSFTSTFITIIFQLFKLYLLGSLCLSKAFSNKY